MGRIMSIKNSNDSIRNFFYYSRHNYIFDIIIYTVLTPEGNSSGTLHDWDAVRCQHATPHTAKPIVIHRNLLACRSDSNKVRISPSRAGLFTFLKIWRFCSSMNSTLTCVHCPCEPVLPSIFITLASTTGLSILYWQKTTSTCTASLTATSNLM